MFAFTKNLFFTMLNSIQSLESIQQEYSKLSPEIEVLGKATKTMIGEVDVTVASAEELKKSFKESLEQNKQILSKVGY